MKLGIGLGESVEEKEWGLGFDVWGWEEIRYRRRRWEGLEMKRESIVLLRMSGERRRER